MAAGPLSPSSVARGKPDFSLPMPPPLLHTRSGNGLYENDRPQTPSNEAFTSPFSTPQGSPSKRQLPPGANDLPNVFESAMVLGPASLAKAGRQQLAPHSPNKSNKQALGENIEDSILRPEYTSGPGSPLRKSNKENTPPAVRQVKEVNYTASQAAISRQEAYQTKEFSDANIKSRYNQHRGLTPEELEKLQMPKVKRLANVTQLCTTPNFG